jgi:hypothetical protein
MNRPDFERAENNFTEAFDSAQRDFQGKIDDVDRSQDVLAGSPAGDALDLLTEKNSSGGFHEVRVTPNMLREDAAPLIGRILLMPNRQLGAFSPVIFTEDPTNPGQFEVTMLNQPFVPEVGFTKGQHFGLSVKAQTRVESFGGHGDSGGFEAGHFSTVLAAASPQGREIANSLVTDGDKATHSVLDDGTPEKLSSLGLMPLDYIKKRLPAGDMQLPVLWHPRLGGDNPAAGDYPDAIRLMMGAEVQAIGTEGIDRAGQLVEDAIKGAK